MKDHDRDADILTVKEAADLLDLSLVKIQRWVHQGKIPCKFRGETCVFRRDELRAWAEEHHLVMRNGARGAPAREEKPWSLEKAVERGGFHFDLEGRDIVDVFTNALARMPLPEEKKPRILEELLDREETASTGIGRGAAIPHPRHVLDVGVETPFVPVFFLKRPVDFNAVDGRPVSVLFFMFSPNVKVHLELLSQLSFCLRSPGFKAALENPDGGRAVLAAVRENESGFSRR